jgi:chromosomal replication initiator protein
MQLWEQILARIQEKVSVQNFQIWFKPTSLDHQDVNKKQLFVWVPNKHFKYWLTENYADVLDEVLRELDMDSFEIHFKVAEEDGLAEGLDRKGIVKAGMKFGGNGAARRLNAKYRFENFVVGFSNQFAHAASMAVAEQPGIYVVRAVYERAYPFNPL